ncbi:MAG: MerR family transcriptional regulator [Rhizomicrobium sp.]
MQIGKFAREAGVSTSAIRFYEKRGLLPPSQRQSNGYRSYDADDLRVIRLINGARALGFTLDDVARFMSRPADERRDKTRLMRALQEKLARLDDHLAEITRQREALISFIARIQK